MKQLFETFLGMFFLFLLMVCSVCCLSASVDARNADKYKTEYIAQLENSNFATGVVEKVFTDAEEHGYKLSMQVYKEVGSQMSVSAECWNMEEFTNLVGDTTGTYMVRLSLTFDYTFPMMNVLSTHTLFGYAK